MARSTEMKLGAIPGFPGLDRLPSGKVRARYRDADGLPCSMTFESNEIRKASAWRTAQIAAVKAGRHVDPADRSSVYEWAVSYVENRPVRDNTAISYAAMLRHLRDTPLGRQRGSQARAAHVQAWVNSKAAVLSPSTVALYYKFVRAVFVWAVENDLIAKTPCRSTIRLPKPIKTAYVVLSEEQVRSLIDEMPERYKALVLLQSKLGLRVGEALGLRPEDIDRDKKTLRVERQRLQSGELGPPKSDHGYREIPLTGVLTAAILRHSLAFPAADDGSMFTTSSKSPLKYTTYIKVFRNAVERAGLPAGTSPHDLRHAAISRWLSRNVPVPTAAKHAGHTVEEMLRTYSHALPQGDELFLSALGDDHGDLRVTQNEAANTPL